MVDMIDAPQVTDNFLRKLYERIKPSMSFEATTPESLLQWKVALRAKVKELLGEFPKPALLKPQLLSREEAERYIREKWVIQSEEDCWVPLYLLIPKGMRGKLPAILCAHGHGTYGKDSVAGVHFNDSDRKASISPTSPRMLLSKSW